jgi:hypothetical protein
MKYNKNNADTIREYQKNYREQQKIKKAIPFYQFIQSS